MPEDVTVIEMRLYLCKTRSDPKYLLDSLYYMAGSRAPYIHVILSYVVSITWYITQPLVSFTTAHYQSAVSMISFAQVWTVQWSDTIPKQNVWFSIGIHLTLFRFDTPTKPMMSLPIRYSPMAFYFWLSIIFHTPQVLWHLLRRRDLFQPLRDCYQLYPIPIAPLVQYHIGDLPYDLWTTSLHFPFLVFSPYPMHSFAVRPIADHHTVWSDLTIHFAAHKPCAHFTYRLYLRLLYLLWKRRKFFSPRTQT